MIKRNLTHWSRILLVSMLLLPFATTSYADDADSLKRLHEMRLLTFGVLGDYYMFSGLEGDTRYNREVESGVKRFENHLAALTTDGNPAAKMASLTKVISSWQAFRQLLDTNRADFLVRGYADARLVSDLSKTALDLGDQLGLAYEEFKSTSKLAISEWTQYCREMSLIIQKITAEYAAHSTSSLGQVARVELTKDGMDAQAERFNTLLQKLQSAPSQEKRIFKMLDQVGVKWEFIAKSIKNYNENAVPFIVSTYGDRIAQNLDTIGDHYSSVATAAK